jgi:hypothetical protein
MAHPVFLDLPNSSKLSLSAGFCVLAAILPAGFCVGGTPVLWLKAARRALQALLSLTAAFERCSGRTPISDKPNDRVCSTGSYLALANGRSAAGQLLARWFALALTTEITTS